MKTGKLENDPPCKTKEEIDAKLKAVTFVVFRNSQRYSPNSYGEDTITRQLETIRTDFDPAQRPYLLKQLLERQVIESDENMWDVGFLSPDEITAYHLLDAS